MGPFGFVTSSSPISCFHCEQTLCTRAHCEFPPQNLLKMFGYKKTDVEGKNVAMLMPQPFSGRHNSYLRNYMNTGKAKILDTKRQVTECVQSLCKCPHLSAPALAPTSSLSCFIPCLPGRRAAPGALCVPGHHLRHKVSLFDAA